MSLPKLHALRSLVHAGCYINFKTVPRLFKRAMRLDHAVIVGGKIRVRGVVAAAFAFEGAGVFGDACACFGRFVLAAIP